MNVHPEKIPRILAWILSALWAFIALRPLLSGPLDPGLLFWTVLPMALAAAFYPREHQVGPATWIYSLLLAGGIVAYHYIYWQALYDPARRADGQGAFLFLILPLLAILPVILGAALVNLFLLRRDLDDVSSPFVWFWRALLVAGLGLTVFLAVPFLPDRRPAGLIDDLHGDGYIFMNSFEHIGLRPVYLSKEPDLDTTACRLVVIGFWNSPNEPITAAELNKLRDFVQTGGGLVCMAAGPLPWEKEEEYPLNILGRTMGFRFLHRRTGPLVLTGESLDLEDEKRPPAEIQLGGSATEPLVRDNQGRVCVGRLRFGQGRVVVFGHHTFARDCPELTQSCLRWAAGMTGNER